MSYINKHVAGLWLCTALFLVLVASVITFVHGLNAQHDVTLNARQSLSQASVNVLRDMRAPVSITAFISKTENGEAKKTIAQFVALYQRTKPDITLRFVDPAADPKAAHDAAIRSNAEISIAYENRRENVTSVSEPVFTNAMQRLLRNAPRPILFVSGHGERSLTGRKNDDLGDFGAQVVARGFVPAPLNLAITQAVPDTAALLLITHPQIDWLAGEAKKVMDYIANGGNVLLLLDAEPSRGLQPVIEAFGLVLSEGKVIDPAAAEMNADVNWSLASAYGQHAAVQNFDLQTVFPYARPISVEGHDGWKSTSLIEVAPRGWVKTGSGDAKTFDDKKDIKGPVIIGVALTRNLRDKPQRVIVVGGGAFLANSYLGNGGNIDLGLNLINWLAQEDNRISIQPRATIDSRLALSRTAQMLLVLVFLIAVPLACFAMGVRVWWKRR